MAYINWKKWWSSISNAAWKEATPTQRLERAKADLKAAGMPKAQWENLTTGQLGSAWAHVPEKMKEEYLGARGGSRRRRGEEVI